MTKYIPTKLDARCKMQDAREKSIPHLKSRILNLKSKPAFTLVELLIVIAIISILSAIGFATFQSAQKKARDSQRKNDLTQIKRALIAARNDCDGGYFPNGDTTTSSLDEKTQFGKLMTYLTNHDDLNTAPITPGLNYLKVQLIDPRNTTTYYYGYKTNSGANANTLVCPMPSSDITQKYAGTQNFVLRAKLEIAQDPDIASTYHKCLDDTSPSTNPITTISWGTDTPPNATDGFYYVCSN